MANSTGRQLPVGTMTGKRNRKGRRYIRFLKTQALLLGYEYQVWAHAFRTPEPTPLLVDVNTLKPLDQSWGIALSKDKRFMDDLKKHDAGRKA